eukprot:scaffold7603_cov73-Isochrysis_galbana.AAC.2
MEDRLPSPREDGGRPSLSRFRTEGFSSPATAVSSSPAVGVLFFPATDILSFPAARVFVLPDGSGLFSPPRDGRALFFPAAGGLFSPAAGVLFLPAAKPPSAARGGASGESPVCVGADTAGGGAPPRAQGRHVYDSASSAAARSRPAHSP